MLSSGGVVVRVVDGAASASESPAVDDGNVVVVATASNSVVGAGVVSGVSTEPSESSEDR
jgi:hypothetical protein